MLDSKNFTQILMAKLLTILAFFKRVSRKKKGSNNRRKARQLSGKRHLKISRQRKDHAVKLARCVIQSNDCVAYEDLRIQNMVKTIAWPSQLTMQDGINSAFG